MFHEWGYTYKINNISAAFSRRVLKFLISTVINEIISMHIEEATENHCSVAQIQQMDAKRQRVWVQFCFWCKKATYSGRAYKTEIFKSLHWTKYYSVKNWMDYWYSHKISQQTIYNMDLNLLEMMHCELESESNSRVWVLYTNMTCQTRKSEILEQLMHHWPTIAVYDYGFQQGGGGWYSQFFCIRRLGSSIYPSPPKNIRNFKRKKMKF